MRKLKRLFEQNQQWANDIRARDPEFFSTLAKQQQPEYLWIGCSDSRVPANQIVGLLPGEVFVHRNIANVVVHTDTNCLSVLEYAIAQLKVKHVMVVGHYGCGGVRAAYEDARVGIVTNWLRNIQDVAAKHRALLEKVTSVDERVNRLCELNCIEQALNVCQTTSARDAWERGQELHVHSWVYALEDGLLRDLQLTVSSFEEVQPVYETALARYGA